MNYQNRDFITKAKFKFSHSQEDIGYEVFTKGKDWRLIVFYLEGEKELEVPRYWFIKGNLTKFEGFISTADEFNLVIKLIQV